MEDMFKDSAPKGTGLGLVTGGINALYATATQQQQIQAQKDWWYEQQKYLEEHNSPAYQSMKLRKAGLNPYQGVGSQPLGNVSSDLPGRPMELFNTGAISGLMQTLSQLDVDEAHANQLDAQAGLFGAQTTTEGQRYRNLVQEWFYNEIMYEIGLIDAEERGIKRDELKKAYEEGNYTPTSDAARAADDKHAESVANVANTQADTDYKEAVTKSENVLRDVTKDQFLQQITESKQRVSLLDAEAKKLIRETEQINNLIERQDIVNAANAFYGINIEHLPPTLQYRLMDNWQKAVRGEIYEETALRVASKAVEDYRDKELHIPRTTSWNESKSKSTGVGPLSKTASESYGWSETY